MATTHPTAIRNTLANTVVDTLDTGVTNAQGQLVFLTAGDVEVSTIDLANPAFGASAAGVATLLGVPLSDPSATGGVTTKYEMQDRDGGATFLGSVTNTGGGGDILLSSTTIGATDVVTITSFTYTAPA